MSDYEPRLYRVAMRSEDLVSFVVGVRETDLTISAERDLSQEALQLVEALRADIEGFIDSWPVFRDSFVPIEVPESAPSIIKRMAQAAAIAGVGPMAAVAGAVAEDVGRGLMAYSRNVIVENGGDVFLSSTKPRDILLHAGASALSGKVAFRVDPREAPIGVCTSSATVGHSTSLGRADAAVVFAPDAAIADAVASGLGNRVRSVTDIEASLDWTLSRPGVIGAVAVVGDKMGVRGAVTLAPAGEAP